MSTIIRLTDKKTSLAAINLLNDKAAFIVVKTLRIQRGRKTVSMDKIGSYHTVVLGVMYF